MVTILERMQLLLIWLTMKNIYNWLAVGKFLIIQSGIMKDKIKSFIVLETFIGFHGIFNLHSNRYLGQFGPSLHLRA